MNDSVRAEHQAYVKKLIDSGDIEGANAYIVDLAEKQMNDGVRTTYNSQKTIISSSESLLKDLKVVQSKTPNDATRFYEGLQKLDRTDFNVYSKGLQTLRNKFALDKNPEMARVFAKVENIASIIINQRYGAAVTDGEMERATQYIAMSGNTLGDMIIKLDEMNATFAAENANLLGSYTGGVADYGAPYTGEPPSDDDFKKMGTYGSGKPPPPPDGGGGKLDTSALPPRFGTLQTNFASGTVTGYGSGAWIYGLDLASPPGTQFKTALPGKVEKVVYNPSWKGSPNSPSGMKQNGGFGNAVTVRYQDGIKLQISHLNSVDVKEGSTVDAGTPLGIVGNTGNTMGATGIHFDITGYWPDGKLMTAKEVAAWMKQQSGQVASSSTRS
jgi:murein DD-endopeptidase MepM/ murein hydrolase activator NlpD